jgi:type VI secretion system protein VasJ
MATYREQVSDKIAPLLAPIAGPSPAGADISYDADFESIKAEIDKLSSVDNSEPAWGKIEQIGAILLSKKGKDLRVVSWMTVAKVKTSAWRGFAESLVLCDSLARSFWDTMFPEARRARARLNAIAWMADMVNQHLVGKEVTLADGDAVRTCDEALKDFDQLLAEKLGDAYPGPGALRSLMRDKVKAIPEPPKAPDPVAPSAAGADGAGAPAAPALVQAPVGPTSPTTVDDVEPAVIASARVIMDGAAVLRAAEPARAWAYKLQRWGAWLAVDGVPAVENGRTYVPSPGEGHGADLEALREGQQWLELLNTAEAMVSDHVFWLDLHRYVATALSQLGPDFAAAQEMVGREVTHFLARAPDIVSMVFSDGMPFANDATKTWLEEEAAKWGAGGGAPKASAKVSAEDEEVAQRFADAEKMVSEGKVPDGLGLAVALADRSPDARTRFRARLRIGKMALDAAKHDLARGMLEHLLSDVERHGLEIWEPATCATLYSYLLAATREVARAKGGSPDLEAKEQKLFDKLCRLDPASAIKLST